jgi:hypothetical protein
MRYSKLLARDLIRMRTLYMVAEFAEYDPLLIDALLLDHLREHGERLVITYELPQDRYVLTLIGEAERQRDIAEIRTALEEADS